MIGRRQFLAFATSALVLGSGEAEATSRAKAKPGKDHYEKALALYNTHTGETVKTVYWADGQFVPQGMKALNKLLRDHRTDEVHPIDPAVIDLLHNLQIKLRSRQPFHIISGYRSPATNAMLAAASDGVATNSLHLQGKAVDIRIPGLSVRTVGRAAMQLRRGGVGIYPASDFVHVDVGRVRSW